MNRSEYQKMYGESNREKLREYKRVWRSNRRKLDKEKMKIKEYKKRGPKDKCIVPEEKYRPLLSYKEYLERDKLRNGKLSTAK